MTTLTAPARSWPPGPGPLALPGVLRRRETDPLGLIVDLTARYGEVVHVSLGSQHVFVISDPEVIHRLLVADGQRVAKWRITGNRRVLFGNGLLTSDGEHHRRQRRLIQPAFHSARMTHYGAVVLRRARELVDGWADGTHIDLADEMTALTTLVVGETMFGTDLRHELAVIQRAIGDTMSYFMLLQPPFGAVRGRVPSPRVRAFRASRADLDALIATLVARRRELGPGEDLLSMLIEARYEDGGVMPDDLIRDELLTMLGAGLETTANALAFALWQLGTHPSAMRRLQAEADAWDGSPDPAALPVAGAVLDETLRLCPPAWMLARRATEDLEVGEWTAPGGSLLLMPPYLLHRNPRHWPRPQRFDIDRWLGGRAPPRAYLPFGAGPRKCIGMSFARMEAVLALATIARDVAVRPAPGPVPSPRPMVTLRPGKGLSMLVERRSSPPPGDGRRSTL